MQGMNVLTGISSSDRKSLLSAIESKKISHAYLFVGEDKNSLEESCRDFLSLIMADEESRELIAERIVKRTHSDITDIYPDGASIKISQLRNITDILQTAPTEGEYNVLIIHEADKMTVQSQNFLLKTIEEPPAGAVIILLASSTENILGTIISRVTKIYAKERKDTITNRETMKFVSERMSQLILEGNIEVIFSTAKALMSSSEEGMKDLSQKDAALMNLEYVYAFFVQMLTYNQSKTEKDYTKEDFGILAGKIGRLCNLNIIDIIKNTIAIISKNASVRLALESMLIHILEECNAENSWNQI